MAVTEVLDDRSKRATLINSFYLPANATVGYVLLGAYGVVTGDSGITASFAIGVQGGPSVVGAGGTIVGPLAIRAGGQYAGGAIQQVFVADTGSGPNGFVVQVGSVAPTFPAGSLPLAVLL